MDISYILNPILTWLVCGTLKFIVNSIKSKKLAFGLIGYGGFPSNHSAIVTSTVTFIFLRSGIDSPAFGVAITLAFIVFLDANSLRGQIEKQAKAINILNANNKNCPKLRERIGHTKIEVLGGALLGVIIGVFIHYISIGA